MGSDDILSWRSAVEALGGSEETMREVAELFLERAPEVLGRMRAAVEGGDAAELREAAHTFKGSSLAIGAKPVADIALRLEKAGAAGALDDAPSTLVELEDAYARLEPALRAHLG